MAQRNIAAILHDRDVTRLHNRRIKRDLNPHHSMIPRLLETVNLHGHTGCVNRIAWSRDGTMLVSGSDDRDIRLWDFATGKCKATIESGSYSFDAPLCFGAREAVCSGSRRCFGR